MNTPKILDCTLRDGGYINDCHFGSQSIDGIISSLEAANIDIIECGYLRGESYNPDRSEFPSMDAFSNKIIKKRKGSLYVLMGIYGEYDFQELPYYQDNYADGIRVTFHSDSIDEALEAVKVIKERGYKLFIQPTATLSYKDSEILKIVEAVNQIDPYAFYIVDTFGEMREYDIIRVSQMIHNNLSPDIGLGFHSHNNLQLSYSNSVAFIDSVYGSRRKLIIDSSVFGMGRGAGNLCTELITEYLNLKYNCHYNARPLLELIDSEIALIREREYWGYSPEYYVSATKRCHPSYARYFTDKITVKFEDISVLLESIEEDKRVDFDKAYAEKVYLSFNEHNVDDRSTVKQLKEMLQGREILLIGPGNSINTYGNSINIMRETKGIFTININHINEVIKPDMVFITNNRRVTAEMASLSENMLLKTSNILPQLNNGELVLDYGKWTYKKKGESSDNPLLILLNLCNSIGVEKVHLAGFDGYSGDLKGNFYSQELESLIHENKALDLNRTITDGIDDFKASLQIDFMTPSIYSQSQRKDVSQ